MYLLADIKFGIARRLCEDLLIIIHDTLETVLHPRLILVVLNGVNTLHVLLYYLINLRDEVLLGTGMHLLDLVVLDTRAHGFLNVSVLLELLVLLLKYLRLTLLKLLEGCAVVLGEG